MRRLPFLLPALLLWQHLAAGQSFGYRADLGPVPAEAYYRILVPPAITSHLQLGFDDLRLYGRKKKEVPYLLVREKPVQQKQLFRPYQVIRKTLSPGVGTTLILRNPPRNAINNISLVIKNTNVRKEAKLSGSPDGYHWFGLEDQYRLQAIASPSATAEVKILNFPLSDYEYYKLDINDSTSAPLNILSAGYYDTQAENGKYSPVTGVQFRQIDSQQVKKTYLRFSAPNPVLIDKMVVRVAAPGLYHREATLYQKQTYTDRRHRTRSAYEPVTHLVLASNNDNTLRLSDFRAGDFYLEIENGDSPPLQVKEVALQQLQTYLVAQLENGQPYYLAFGHADLDAPDYDLSYFADKLPQDIPTLQPGRIQVLAGGQKGSGNRLNDLFRNRYLIWAAILGVIALLGYMTYKMLRETGKGK